MTAFQKNCFSCFARLLTAVLLLISTTPSHAYYVPINETHGVLSNESYYSDTSFSPVSDKYTNNIVTTELDVSYNAYVTHDITGDMTFQNNTLNLLPNNWFSQVAPGPVTPVYLKITNNYNTTPTDLSGLSFTIQNNTFNATANSTDISGVTGSIYGALIEANNSNIGNVTLTNNIVNSAVDTHLDTSEDESALTGTEIYGAAAILNATGYNSSISMNSNVDANQVKITDGTINTDVFGGKILGTISDKAPGIAISGNVQNNIVTVDKGTFYGSVTGGALAVDSQNESKTLNITGNVTANQLVINNGEYQGSTLTGGYLSLSGYKAKNDSVLTSSVQNNTITINGGTFYNNYIIGGVTVAQDRTGMNVTGDISGNTIEIDGGTFYGNTWLSGGFTNGTNDYKHNTLILKKSGISVYGVDGFDTYTFDLTDAANGTTYLTAAQGNGHNNTLFQMLTPSAINGAWDIDGATVNWSSTENPRPANLALGGTVTLLKENGGYGLSGTLANAGSTNVVDGGNTYTYTLAKSPDNKSVYLIHDKLVTDNAWNTDVSFAAGAYDDVSMTINNTLTAQNISVASNANAAASLTANTLDITANDTALNLTADNPTQLNATFTTINLDNGHNLTKSGNAFYTFTNMNVNDNANISSLDVVENAATLTLASGKTANIDTLNLMRGAQLTLAGSGSYNLTNELNVYGTGNKLTGDLTAAGKNLNFFLEDTTAANATALQVTGNADITNSNVKVGILGGPKAALQLEDQVVLVDAATVTGAPVNGTGVGMTGLMIKYQFDVETVGNQLIATVTNTQLSDNAKAFSEGRAVSAALVSQGADFAAQDSMTAAQQAAETTNGLATFAVVGGGKSRYETGSHIDLTSFNAAVGLSHEVEYWFNADWLLSSFIEYGTANYDTYNSFFSGNVKGKGNSQYIGLGVLGKRTSLKDNYMEVSARIGRMKTDFKGAVYNASDADYDYSVPYYGAHIGLGHLWKWTNGLSLDLFGKYLWSHQDSKTVSVSSGDEIHFKNTDSHRLRGGARVNWLLDNSWAPYVGAAYDYELDGKAHATTYDMSINAPSLKGGSAVGEAGITYSGETMTFSVGGEGYAGRRRGASGHIRFGFAF